MTRSTRRLPLAAVAGVAASAALLSGCGLISALPVDPSSLGGLAATSIVEYADGTKLTTLHAEQDRRPMELREIPKILRDAVIAAEDRRYYEHDGVDLRGILRAAAVDAKSGRVDEGGSTITQQLVKNTLVTPERSFHRKIREAALAVGLEQTLTKDEILERYLNTVYFGEGAYGVGAAVRTYFGHVPTRVSVPEAALLAGLIRSPATADPVEHRDAAAARRATVLAQMVSTGAITEAQATTAVTAPLPRRVHRDDEHYPAPFAVSAAVQQLLDDRRLGATRKERENAIFRGGLHIRLTIDPDEQEAAEAAVTSVLTRKADPDAAVASVEPGDGAIRALVGGRNFWSKSSTAKVNLAYGGTTKRQAGSTFKVFDLITALEHGISPDDMFETGRNVVIPRTVGPDWNVTNYEGEAFGSISLRTATELSVNTAYARIVTAIGDGDADTGAAAVVDTAEKLGITGAGGSKLRVDPSTTLGAQEVDPVAMAGAYAALAADGMYSTPYLIAEVRDANGKVLIKSAAKPHRVIPKGIAATANDILQGVVNQGTGVRARLPRPVAGKTGTATDYHDAWFVGYTPNFAAAVWMGVATGEVSMTPEHGFPLVIAGGTLPAEIWRRFAGTALLGRPAPSFTIPDGATVSVRLDVIRDCVPNRWTPASAIEEKSFLQGTQPKNVCTVPIGPPPSTMPDLVGLPSDDARQRLEQYGFVVRTVDTYDPRYPVGTVTGQMPSSTSSVTPGATVTLTLAAHTGVSSTVPDVLGLDTVAAEQAIKRAGYVVELTVEESCHGPSLRCAEENQTVAGKVWRQDVAAGTQLPVGAHVPITVGP